jgi:hypothetical protein
MTRSRVLTVVAVALLVAACGGSTPTGGSGVTTSSPAATGISSAPPTTGSSGASASSEPVASQPAATAAPGDTPAPSDASVPSDSPSPAAAVGADACSGSDANRAFYANLAQSVGWTVYCAVLPKGWYVSAGSYRLANGGKLLISYKGPDGATLSLSEGSFCTDGTGCVPAGTDSGAARFGSLPATLVAVDGGGYAIVAARGQTPSWLMVTTGLDQATTMAYGEALAEVTR